MTQQLISKNMDWQAILSRMHQQEGQPYPTYAGNLKTALIIQAGLAQDDQGEALYQIAVEIAELTTCCDPEITYWFSRLVALIAS